MALEKRLKQFGNLKGAPDWWGKPLRDLDFEWSKEEKLEIERYCEKILKNVSEEDMTPLQRLKATWEGKPKDRVLVFIHYGTVYGMRTLDSAGHIVKPIDGFRNPKLFVKAELATVARFKSDYPDCYGISYGEELWGANAKLIDYGNPVLDGPFPVKKIEDMDGFEVPDPKQDGMAPGNLWSLREIRRTFDDYGISKVMAMHPCMWGCPVGTVMMNMIGWAPFAVALRKNPDLDKKALELTTQFEIKLGQAIIDVCRPDGIMMSAITGATPAKNQGVDNTWIADYWARIGKPLASQTHLIYASAFGQTNNWLPVMKEHGALSWDSFCGMLLDPVCDPVVAVNWHKENGLYIGIMPSNKVLLDGPVSAIEEDEKKMIDIAKTHSKAFIGLGMLDYWTPQPHLDAGVAFARKYGKF